MGESFGNYTIGQDEALMDYVSSVNVACGFHGGDPSVMRRTVDLAVKKEIAIGAHPGYQDMQGFGRREMKYSAQEIYDIVLYQIGALTAFVKAKGTRLHHVKPHGALYNTAVKDKTIASAIAHAVRDSDKDLLLVGLSGSYLIDEAHALCLKTASEVFADRTYQDDGTLTPRTHANALHEKADAVANQVLNMVKRQMVTALSGKQVHVKAETICIHGDGSHAFAFAKAIVTTLKQNNVIIKRP